jgi:hypothetical protein
LQDASLGALGNHTEQRMGSKIANKNALLQQLITYSTKATAVIPGYVVQACKTRLVIVFEASAPIPQRKIFVSRKICLSNKTVSVLVKIIRSKIHAIQVVEKTFFVVRKTFFVATKTVCVATKTVWVATQTVCVARKLFG